MNQTELQQRINEAVDQNATELDLSNEGLRWLPSEISLAKRLERLVLDNNELTELPPGIVELSNLQSLEVNNNQLRVLPQRLSSLERLRDLGLSNNALSDLPDEFCGLRSLASLGLANNRLRELPEKFGKLRRLKDVGLANNRLAGLPDSFADLDELMILELSENELKSWPAPLSSLERLSELWLGFNNLTKLPAGIRKLSDLKVLYLRGNRLETLPSGLGKLASLEYLDIAHNRLSTFPDKLCKLSSLSRLNLTANRLSELPSRLGDLQALEELTVERNSLSELPETLGNLKALTLLQLGNNRLRKLPGSVGGLKALSELGLNHNRLTEIPAAIGELTELRVLSLEGNKIEIPGSQVQELKGLNELILRDNRITEFPAALTELSNLAKIDLGTNRIEKVPREIKNLDELQTLDLSGNRLAELCEEIGCLKELEVLVLDDNLLEELPPGISEAGALRELRLSRNRLQALPGTIATLRKLRYLDLANNSLLALPNGIGDLEDLRRLDVSGNKLEELPEEIGKLSRLKELIVNKGKSRKGTLVRLPSSIAKLDNLEILMVAGNVLRDLPDKLADLESLTELILDDNRIEVLPTKLGTNGGLATLSCSGNPAARRPDPRSEVWVDWLEGRGNSDYQSLPKPRRAGFPAIHVNSIRLENVRAFAGKRNTLRFDESGCTLLGENAAGKSTVLKAIAIALLGPKLANQLELSPASYLRHGESRGLIEIRFGLRFDQSEFAPAFFSVGIAIIENESRFDVAREEDMSSKSSGNAAERIDWLRGRRDATLGFSCAYGATRFFSTDRYGVVSEDPDPEKARVLSLFEPGRPMLNPAVLRNILSGSLANLPNAPERKLSQHTLNGIDQRLRNLVEGVQGLDSKSGKLHFHSGTFDAEDLSEGLATQLGLVSHLIRHLLEASGWQSDLFDLPGVVLIDEVDLHLHPRWQRTVLGQLKQAFPRIQFIVSTHSALVAGSIPSGSIRVLRSNKDRVQIISDDLPDHDGWRADQVLTSPLFGLGTSRGVALMLEINEYHKLLEAHGAANDRVQELRSRIRKQLDFTRDDILDQKTLELIREVITTKHAGLPEDEKKLLSVKLSLILGEKR